MESTRAVASLGTITGGRRWRTFLAGIVCLVGVAACAEEARPTPTRGLTPTATQRPAPTPTPMIPGDVSYSIIDTSVVPGIKRSLDVRLNRKVSEDVLRAIAHELKSGDSEDYDRTFIVYYLPDMEVDSGGWATTHFDPELVIQVIGTTLEDEQSLTTQVGPSDRDVIGKWLWELVGGVITIYREDDTLYIEQKFSDGSELTEELVEKPSPLGQRFDKVEPGFGDYWIIDTAGNLQLRDSAGLISTEKKIP